LTSVFRYYPMAERSRSLIALPDGEFDGAFIGSNRMGHVQRAGRYVPPANVAIPWSSL